MYERRRFFRTMISNMNMVLANTDLPIATPYAELLEERRRKNDAKCDEDGCHCLVLRADAGFRAVVPAGSGNRSLRPRGGDSTQSPGCTPRNWARASEKSGLS